MPTASTTTNLEQRLAHVRTDLRRLTRFLTGTDADDPDLTAAAYETIASVASVEATLLRGEEALR